jgi:uncharacterized protein YaaN involved in tellurite resistance
MTDQLQPQDLQPSAVVIPPPSPDPARETTLAMLGADPQHLTAEQAERAKAIADAFDIEKPQAILDFGSAAQKGISRFSTHLLEQVRTKDAGEAGDALMNLMLKVTSADIDGLTAPGEMANLPVIGPLFDAGRRWAARFEKVNSEIENIEDALERAQRGLTKDIVMFDELFSQNRAYFDDLNVHIAAGEMKVQELHLATLPEARRQAAESRSPMDAQHVKDLESRCARFEKKLHDLRLARTIAIQTAPQIRIIQSNDQVLVDKIQSSVMNTLPLWRSQVVVGVGLVRQKRALEMQRHVDETTNALLAKNAELLRQGSIDVAKQNERGIVDVETLRRVNADLVTTIDETLRIQEDGREKRAAVERELVSLEKDLREKVVLAANS